MGYDSVLHDPPWPPRGTSRGQERAGPTGRRGVGALGIQLRGRTELLLGSGLGAAKPAEHGGAPQGIGIQAWVPVRAWKFDSVCRKRGQHGPASPYSDTGLVVSVEGDRPTPHLDFHDGHERVRDRLELRHLRALLWAG